MKIYIIVFLLQHNIIIIIIITECDVSFFEE